MAPKRRNRCRTPTSDGANIIQWSRNNGDGQRFLFFALDGGMYAIAAKNSGKVWDVNGGSTSDKANIAQFSWHGDTNQQWYTNNVSSDYEIINKNSGKVADVSGGSTSDGANISQFSRHNGNNQKWSFKAVESTPLPAVLNTKPLPDIPKYTSSPNEVLPAQTIPVITATALLPCIMVEDNRWDYRDKIQSSPYYNFVKEQYWERVES
ncbi:RICIN domain-containing protein, partial [Bacillus cereus]|uniref:RICIN domain-containing protein n=1 Tax=Bacillus cereus TaxID=1396 RepID=UPI0011454197